MTINMVTSGATTTSVIDYSKLKFTSSATTTTKSTAESTNDENKVKDTARRHNISEYNDSVEISDEGRKLQKEGMPEGPPPGGIPPTKDASTSATSTDEELTEEEKLYDADGDGKLSLEEEAAYLEAQANKKALEIASKSNETLKDVSTNTNDEATKLQKDGIQRKPPQGSPQGAPPNVNEMSDDDLKSMLSHMKDKNGELPKELSSYNDADIDNLSEEDLKNIRETMTQMQEKMAEKMNGQTSNEQQLLINKAITAYNNFK